jgi:hypothetical protein
LAVHSLSTMVVVVVVSMQVGEMIASRKVGLLVSRSQSRIHKRIDHLELAGRMNGSSLSIGQSEWELLAQHLQT